MPLQKQIKNKFWKPATETRNKDYTLLDFSLGRITFLNTLEKQKVYDYLLSLENDGSDPCVKLSEMTVPEISSVIGRNLTGRIDWKGNGNLKAAQKELETCRILKIGFLRYSEFRYPAMLKTISNIKEVHARGAYSLCITNKEIEGEIMELWFSDYHTDRVKLSVKVDKQLYGKQTDYQRIDVFESDTNFMY